jgi:hypothetical protein
LKKICVWESIATSCTWCSDLVSDRNRNDHFRPKPNIRQPKTTEYSVSAEYSTYQFCQKNKSNFTLIISILSGLYSKLLTFGRKYKKVPNIRPKPNIQCFLAAKYSVLAESENSCFGQTLILTYILILPTTLQ